MIMGVRATGRKSLNSTGLGLLGTGLIIDFFHRAGMAFELNDRLNSLAKIPENCSLHAFSTLPLRLSGPVAFLMLNLFNSL